MSERCAVYGGREETREEEGITKKFDHRSENWMKFDTSSSFWNIIQVRLLVSLDRK